MPIHQISVRPVSRDSLLDEQGNIGTINKSKENEAHSSPQGALATASCQEVCSGNLGSHGLDHTPDIFSVSHTPISNQQVKRRYRRQRKSTGCITECVDKPADPDAHNDSSSEDEQFHRAARSWSREKARRRRRPRVLSCSRENEAQKQDLKTLPMTTLQMEVLDSKSANHARHDGKGNKEEGLITKMYEEQGLGETDFSVPTLHKYTDASNQNGTPPEVSNDDDEPEVCRICHSEGDEECPLIMPCRCTGSLRFVHHACLRQWIKSSDTRCCELCQYNFIMETHLKPLRKWENMQMSPSERRRTFCSVIFHLVAVACVAWSVYVFVLSNNLAEQKSKEHNELMEQLFWTKLGIVALSAVSGLVFMYIQCKLYLKLWRRLKAFNCVIFVHNCPDSVCNKGGKSPSCHVVPTKQIQTNALCSEAAGGGAEEVPV